MPSPTPSTTTGPQPTPPRRSPMPPHRSLTPWISAFWRSGRGGAEVGAEEAAPAQLLGAASPRCCRALSSAHGQQRGQGSGTQKPTGPAVPITAGPPVPVPDSGGGSWTGGGGGSAGRACTAVGNVVWEWSMQGKAGRVLQGKAGTCPNNLCPLATRSSTSSPSSLPPSLRGRAGGASLLLQVTARWAATHPPLPFLRQ
jgi:hypothetical protein